MGFIQQRTSDISGEVIPEAEVVTVVVKHEGKVFDAKASELSGIKEVTGVIEVELRYPNGETKKLLTTEKDFYAVVPKKVVEAAPSNRGRRPGYRPQSVAS